MPSATAKAEASMTEVSAATIELRFSRTILDTSQPAETLEYFSEQGTFVPDLLEGSISCSLEPHGDSRGAATASSKLANLSTAALPTLLFSGLKRRYFESS